MFIEICSLVKFLLKPLPPVAILKAKKKIFTLQHPDLIFTITFFNQYTNNNDNNNNVDHYDYI